MNAPLKCSHDQGEVANIVANILAEKVEDKIVWVGCQDDAIKILEDLVSQVEAETGMEDSDDW